MSPVVDVNVAGAVVALSVTVLLGIAVHELSHVLALRLAGVRCRVTVLPGREDAGPHGPGADAPGAWATVTPTAVPDGLPLWRLRAAAMAPLCLLAPFALVAVGVFPDPFAGSLPLRAAAVGWLGCALPSPSDFSLLWYPGRALDDFRADDAG